MSDHASGQSAPDLQAVLEELAAQEPIFHRPQFASTTDDFARLMSPDYWEVGASGSIYDRAFILEHLDANPPVDASTANWTTTDFHCRQLSTDTFLLTYALDQNIRHTRRSTIWQRTESGWQIIYHQGTVSPIF